MDYSDMIEHAWQRLDQATAEFPAADREAIRQAYLLAAEAHKSQKRKSGLPYILHPLSVALITVSEMRQRDGAIVCAALLHDVVEDTPHTLEEIQERFGDDVAFLVGAVTKPNKMQVDNFQHILGSIKGDIRVLVLKLSDRLHNMRTLDGLRPQKQWKIASETQFFFAPLAGRLGLYKIKSELENLAFRFLNPNEYAYIEKTLEEDKERTRTATESFLLAAQHVVARQLGDAVRWDIRYRKPYSVWREMQELGCDFYHVPFKHYIRAVFQPEEVAAQTGWQDPDEQDIALKIYRCLAERYREQTGSFVNYIAQPKANGYRSVHVRLLNPFGGIEEFHISSENMREQSHFGCIVENKERWLQRLTEVLNELSEDPASMMPGIRDSLYNEDIVAYTPKSKPITLPKGATALDFAYGVHTDIGDHARYARINGQLCSLRTKLKRGDCVEIGTGKETHPRAEWLDGVVSYKARKHIRGYLNKLPRPKYNLCPHCHPMPGSEIIGFEDSEGRITLHSRNCPEAIRMASEKGSTIVDIRDFTESPDVLFPVKIAITGIDRFHFLREIIDFIVDRHHLSMSALETLSEDNIVTCKVDFAIHSTTELNEMLAGISAIDGVEEVRRLA
ncbi:MAG: bifunctional (p)ppGpp synthetase/guanosine-3',5'-bis(diphosphate) 3'-pyrophosphohydrolase [Bacteroidales bacterium]|nr:bifunctional (p)ppGpp synthetase/guanosine-3',5'-bis(diphosphate) 3'-pyrophosphohydrolase [Bacteroidales bacterium]